MSEPEATEKDLHTTLAALEELHKKATPVICEPENRNAFTLRCIHCQRLWEYYSPNWQVKCPVLAAKQCEEFRNAFPDLSQWIRKLERDAVCDVCCGTGNPGNGKPCVCGGTGRTIDQALGFRRSINDLHELIEAEEAKVRKLVAERDELIDLLTWAQEWWVEIECGPASKKGLEVTVIRLERGQGEQRIFRGASIVEALTLAKYTPGFQGESVPQCRDRITAEVLEARQQIAAQAAEIVELRDDRERLNEAEKRKHLPSFSKSTGMWSYAPWPSSARWKTLREAIDAARLPKTDLDGSHKK